MNNKIIFTFVVTALGMLTITFAACKQGAYSVNSKTDEVNVSSPNNKTIDLTWEQMVLEIQKGQYKGVFQAHSKMLKLIGSDGTVYQAIQPEIDAYLKVIGNCKACPNVPIATE